MSNTTFNLGTWTVVAATDGKQVYWHLSSSIGTGRVEFGRLWGRGFVETSVGGLVSDEFRQLPHAAEWIARVLKVPAENARQALESQGITAYLGSDS